MLTAKQEVDFDLFLSFFSSYFYQLETFFFLIVLDTTKETGLEALVGCPDASTMTLLPSSLVPTAV